MIGNTYGKNIDKGSENVGTASLAGKIPEVLLDVGKVLKKNITNVLPWADSVGSCPRESLANPDG